MDRHCGPAISAAPTKQSEVVSALRDERQNFLLALRPRTVVHTSGRLRSAPVRLETYFFSVAIRTRTRVPLKSRNVFIASGGASRAIDPGVFGSSVRFCR